jgi:PncC family amidohydrolase
MDTEISGIISKIHDICRKNELTLSVAESCTGGLISHYITLLPGASRFFRGGITAYSIRAKRDILGVSEKTIAEHGVVSEETAREMAERMRELLDTDCSISTTGNLGPDVLDGKMAGIIFIAVSIGDQTFSKGLRLKGDRTENKEKTALEALRMLLEGLNIIMQ